ncbi:helix-turn-helix domain-containing protein [Fluviispira vulneris]|uniref:helix-turn-helix domain-containing protein n=1 Tax=Fluviispira vulneris TaxID=2763012 RepID=UPI001648A861|nr:helix-turn-helix domain-containing protein [Fluviispira vulneris]
MFLIAMIDKEVSEKNLDESSFNSKCIDVFLNEIHKVEFSANLKSLRVLIENCLSFLQEEKRKYLLPEDISFVVNQYKRRKFIRNEQVHYKKIINYILSSKNGEELLKQIEACNNYKEIKNTFQKVLIDLAIQKYGNKATAAEMLGIARQSMYRI